MVILRGHHLVLLHEMHLYFDDIDSYKESLRIVQLYEGFSEEKAKNLVEALEKATHSNEIIVLTDGLDDICKPCIKRESSWCTIYTPSPFSAPAADRKALAHYGLVIDTNHPYRGAYIREMLLSKPLFENR